MPELQQNRHHLWWPKRDYLDSVGRVFRGLPCHILPLDIEIHRIIHAYLPPPRKPSRDEMLRAIERHNRRECVCGSHSGS